MKSCVTASSLRIAIGTVPRSPRSCPSLSTTSLLAFLAGLQQPKTAYSTLATSYRIPAPSLLHLQHLSSPRKSSIFRQAEHRSTVSSPFGRRHIMNGTAAPAAWKRKEAPELLDGRHKKHPRGISGKQSAGDNTPDINDELENGDDYGLDDARLPILPIAGVDTAEWQATVENVIRNVVSIRFCQTASFDTDPALTSEATGFVVDAERG